jgi:hypothetical protein
MSLPKKIEVRNIIPDKDRALADVCVAVNQLIDHLAKPEPEKPEKVMIGEEVFLIVKVLEIRDDNNMLVEIKTIYSNNVTAVVSIEYIKRA